MTRYTKLWLLLGGVASSGSMVAVTTLLSGSDIAVIVTGLAGATAAAFSAAASSKAKRVESGTTLRTVHLQRVVDERNRLEEKVERLEDEVDELKVRVHDYRVSDANLHIGILMLSSQIQAAGMVPKWVHIEP